MKKSLLIVCIGCFLYQNIVMAKPLLNFVNKDAINFHKVLKVGQVELLDFADPVSLAHYGTSKQSLDYIELEKLEPSKNGYKKFMIKAKAPGTGELSFRSGKDFIKIRVLVEQDYSALEDELNQLFGIDNAKAEDRIQVVSANLVSNVDENRVVSIYLKGQVETAKDALLATSFAANALGDHGVKIFSNPGGQLRLKDLEAEKTANANPFQTNDSSFVEFYENTNKLIDTNNLYRDLVLASENEKVISFLKISEPKRFAVKVRFLEMDSRYVDDFVSGFKVRGSNDRFDGIIGQAAGSRANFNAVSGFASAGSSFLSGGNLVTGTAHLFDNTFLDLEINDLLQEGVLRVVNEFSLVTHSGDMVSLGKGTRFPVPKLNNGVGNSSISIEYIPIGFKGELKVTALETKLIDVQLASRLSTAESTASFIEGFEVPVFKEEYVNSAAMLVDGQEVVLNAFMTETETLAKSSSPLGRIIPFLGSSKKKQKTKSLLFVALVAKEMKASSQVPDKLAGDFDLPHVNLHKYHNIYADHNSKLRKKDIKDSVDISLLNGDEKMTESQLVKMNSVDPLALENEEGDL